MGWKRHHVILASAFFRKAISISFPLCEFSKGLGHSFLAKVEEDGRLEDELYFTAAL